MKKQLIKKANNLTTRFGAKLQLLGHHCKKTLQSESGIEMIQVILMTAIVIVIGVVIFFPELTKLVKGSFDNADTKMDSIWNYKG
ncbi:hypothetical protein EDD70_0515 [Hydrogenoanaerobacterium saccharovorans]|uniref:Flagellin, Flp1-like, domain n=1 Tax=Hydrogenoanaerobacterium saccharovorans TaxID=474960 RepID=A0A1H8AY96_9FIRM|nr:hypothetical protein [Hydrogenoanaerobacterium saccharovorans]RPF47716.1 hypothetical protein EDD70_0515 [Hydrogenoanaerobacterium saccharovorans]SEM74884.1 hypothetical protein SAMN05216180_1576 [Hydrogenoanaerobacterium saccharovorans]